MNGIPTVAFRLLYDEDQHTTPQGVVPSDQLPSVYNHEPCHAPLIELKATNRSAVTVRLPPSFSVLVTSGHYVGLHSGIRCSLSCLDGIYSANW
jgi:hypothetical protein